VTGYEALKATVTEILSLLTTHGDTYVVDRLSADLVLLEAGDQSVIQTLHSEATGSMGSLRDRYLCVENGDRITEFEREAVNARLGALVERLAQQTQPARSKLRS
jgi:hypothetical protein